VLEHVAVREKLGQAMPRLLSLDLVDADTKGQHAAATPRSYRATIYDYTNNRTLLVLGRLNNLDQVEATESAIQSLSSREEFDEAMEVLARDERVGAELRIVGPELQPFNW
jgi:hypothetical protein